MKWIIYFSVCLSAFCYSCKKTNSPPVADFTVEPSTGHYSETFEFDASQSSDQEDPHSDLVYRWDFNNDGIWETEWLSNEITRFSYDTIGIFMALLEVMDSDGEIGNITSPVTVIGGNKKDILIDTRDGQVYGTVLIDSIWWMTENLNYGNWISYYSDLYQSDNNQIEKYYYQDLQEYIGLGGFYNFREAFNYNLSSHTGLCPPGWRIPSESNWRQLISNCPVGEMDLSPYLGLHGSIGIDLLLTGCIRFNKYSEMKDLSGFYWTSTFQAILKDVSSFEVFVYGLRGFRIDFDEYKDSSSHFGDYLNGLAVNIRCIKDR